MEVTQSIKLNINDTGNYCVVTVKQGDTGRKLNVTMCDGQTELVIPSSATVSVRVLKADGTSVDDAATVENGKAIVELTEQMTAVEGYAKADVSVASDGKIVSTATFLLKVGAIPLGAEIISENEFTQLSELIASASAYESRIGDLEGNPKIWYGSSLTSASTAVKVVLCSNFELKSGDYIAIFWRVENTSTSDIMLNINNTGEYPVYADDDKTAYGFYANTISLFRVTKSGSSWYYRLVGNVNSLAPSLKNRVIVTDASGRFTASSVTATELGYLSGVTSNVQEQIDEAMASGGSSVPTTVRSAILALFQAGAYAETGLTDEIAVIQAWASSDVPGLVSISAVYTQSGTVYDTDSLDDLKDDLVVTAHYSDSTTETVTTYTLSGTLTEGTSTITVAYGGKTTTFDVTVSGDRALYPLTNGTYQSSSGKVILTITNNNHVRVEWTDSVSGNLFINLTSGDISASNSGINNQPEWFTIPSGVESILTLSNLTNNGVNFQSNFKIANSTASGSFTTGIISSSSDVTITNTLASAESVSCLFMYVTGMSANEYVEFDVGFTVGGTQYI